MAASEPVVRTSPLQETTIGKSVRYEGVSLHRGEIVCVNFCPAKAGSGIVFVRTDCGVEIPAHADHVVETRLSTTLGIDKIRIQTTEHILAAAYGLGILNLRIELNGPELPIADGSALPYVNLLLDAGIVHPNADAQDRVPMTLDAPLFVAGPQGTAAWISASPLDALDALSLSYTVDYDPPAGAQHFCYDHSPKAFIEQIAPARTFAFMKDVEEMHAAGLALGGSLENAIVFSGLGLLNPEGLRFEDEPVRHKILDLIGDLALLGRPLLGKIEAVRAGHALHLRLVQQILARACTADVSRV